jgi:hypothetical protein
MLKHKSDLAGTFKMFSNLQEHHVRYFCPGTCEQKEKETKKEKADDWRGGGRVSKKMFSDSSSKQKKTYGLYSLALGSSHRYFLGDIVVWQPLIKFRDSVGGAVVSLSVRMLSRVSNHGFNCGKTEEGASAGSGCA